MAYSKIKHVESAQKHLAQNRVPQAINEYQQILKHEPSDQVTLMTIGDLYVRQGETFQAIDYFARLAQIFVRDGFLTKAIAIYKKIAKLAPEEMKPLERLAELYVQQGVLSEARPLFLQLAEGHLKAGRREPAAALLRKLLEAEPDNLRVQLRLAEVQIAMGQPQDAAQTFLVCAERQLAHHDPDEAVKLVARSLELAPNNPAAQLLKARALSAAGKPNDATDLLEALPNLDTGNEAADHLLEIYLQDGQAENACRLAQRILAHDPKNYAMAVKTVSAVLETDKPEGVLNLLGSMRKPMADHGDTEQLSQMLQAAATRLPGRMEPHEWLVELYTQVNDAFHLPQALAQLGQAAAAAGHFDRARQVYEQLIERSPEDGNIRKNLEQVRSRLGMDPLAAAESTPVPVIEEVVEAQKFEEPALDAETQQFVALALTDVDLFSSYGLTPKAIDLLERVLERAPRHTPSIEKLLDLYLGEGNNQRTAELAEHLWKIHEERGDTANAERFSELYRRFQRAASLDPEPQQAPAEFALPPARPVETEFSIPVPPPQIGMEGAASVVDEILAQSSQTELDPDATQELVHEVDLSDEWASISGQIHGEPAQAKASGAKETAEPKPAHETSFVEANTSSFAIDDDTVLEDETVLEIEDSTDDDAVILDDAASSPLLSMPGIELDSPSVESHAGAQEEVQATDEPAEYELELLEAMPQGSGSSNVSPIRAAAPESDAGPLGDLALELGMVLDAALPGATNKGPAFSPSTEGSHKNGDSPSAFPVPSVPLIEASAPGGPLSEIFAEFRDALDELQSDEDPETHYNLGIAYREMGLLEEAISEFQKVVQSHDRGKPFRYTMQCCTLLALGFMEKGQAEIACFWYERALLTPDLDQEAILALQYDLGVSQEVAGRTEDALRSFQRVYAMNIDYRDVAERIGALTQR
jgi:tetratricopeptide (TPR) repeat protein